LQWDAEHPLHKGRLGEFSYFKSFWGTFLNAPAQ
jgi:peptide/nickel transport system substrate-binding protein